MATSLLALLDDIATVLDDVALLTKVAAKKTASVLGDDLALNAEQVRGVRAERELPVVWGVAKGSAVNKLILVPLALAISAMAPWAILPLLMIGGLYLCYEGAEKIAHKFGHGGEEAESRHAELTAALEDPNVDLAALERDKIRGAIRTDFVLSAEIIVITLGTVEQASFLTQILVLTGIAIVMTIGVYGLVAGIVKLDDAGLYLSRRPGTDWRAVAVRAFGGVLLRAAPWLMKALAVAGTIAMFLVGGGIIVHGLPVLHHAIEHLGASLGAVAAIGPLLGALTPLVVNALVGLAAGAAVLAAWTWTRARLEQR
ncbi:DUF808 domain-containing protein [Allochromatium vinosum]|uniref:Inner membrane protein YedI n=1 Tax=Allochromatium vinosum (strain ATCC 17899 / DSM 180 / NBRC 103801 / NCIMB 10441 / D) TaxID=572477 RepID=D3RT18_ALLVD|nr:DUF808 domain-containing protein [Allochromatium vinosum]ADC62327.1 protein of unknown function DUF808 [Allochromatium vinosum DSM 180]MBK1653271.1 DUF808 domain-containing protein [Allochromatium vinosum]